MLFLRCTMGGVLCLFTWQEYKSLDKKVCVIVCTYVWGEGANSSIDLLGAGNRTLLLGVCLLLLLNELA